MVRIVEASGQFTSFSSLVFAGQGIAGHSYLETVERGWNSLFDHPSREFIRETLSVAIVSLISNTCCGPQAALSRVALPSHTQSCAFVVDSLGGLLPDANWLAAALALAAPDSTGSAEPANGESGGWGLNLLA